MIRLDMKKYNMILIDKQPKYQLYHQVKFVNMNILPSNQQQIIEQTKFTYSPLGKAFEKQIKTIEDQGQKQLDALDALKDLKSKEQTKPIEDKSNNQPKAAIIFNELINERKKIISKLYDSTDYKNLKLEYVGLPKM